MYSSQFSKALLFSALSLILIRPVGAQNPNFQSSYPYSESGQNSSPNPNLPPDYGQNKIYRGQAPNQQYGQAQGYNNPYAQNTQQKLGGTANPQQAAKVYQWFLSYDEIRRRAQMNPIEKQQADSLLARGLGFFMPGQDKLQAKQLLSSLVQRYQLAAQSLQALPLIPETKQLQEAYFHYFENACMLFSDYLRVQDNVFAVDRSGQSIAKQLIQRKLALEALEHSCKESDAQLRQYFGVAAYQY
ncbi:MAG: hypothetical protein K2X27_21380 [Candidatus Obscuribacterales bacterium]|nr:hypothetical protein [Candidatus Obscuribacterales bacterium]